MRSFRLMFFQCHITKKYLLHIAEDCIKGIEEVRKMCPTPIKFLGDVFPASLMDSMKCHEILGYKEEGWFLPNECAINWINGLISGKISLDEMYSDGTNPHYKNITNANRTQWQVITGSLIGSGYIQKVGSGYCFGMTESKDVNWLNYKIAELCKLGNSKIIIDGKLFRWRTRVNAICFDSFIQNHYNKKIKTIKSVALEQIMDTGLMVWYIDKGFWRTRSTIAFRTSYLDDNGNLSIVNFLNSVDINAKFKKYARSKQIILDKNGTDKFLTTIASRVPYFMEYRLEP